MLRIIFLILAEFLLVSCEKAPPAINQNLDQAIKNGQPEDPNSDVGHSVVKLNFKGADGNTYGCSATLVDSRIILTAAHCFKDPDDVLFTDHVVTWGNPVHKIKIVKNSFHPLYSRKNHMDEFDIALGLLESEMPAPYAPSRVASDISEIPKQEIYGAGFGNTMSKTNTSSGLHSARVKFISPEKTEALIKKGMISPGEAINKPFSFHFTTDQEDPATPGFCSGDSGGPIYYKKNKQIYVFGVNSRINESQPCDGFDKLTSVFYFRNFLAEAYGDLLREINKPVGAGAVLPWRNPNKTLADPEFLEIPLAYRPGPFRMILGGRAYLFKRARIVESGRIQNSFFSGPIHQEIQFSTDENLNCDANPLAIGAMPSMGVLWQESNFDMQGRFTAILAKERRYLETYLHAYLFQIDKNKLTINLQVDGKPVQTVQMNYLNCTGKTY